MTRLRFAIFVDNWKALNPHEQGVHASYPQLSTLFFHKLRSCGFESGAPIRRLISDCGDFCGKALERLLPFCRQFWNTRGLPLFQTLFTALMSGFSNGFQTPQSRMYRRFLTVARVFHRAYYYSYYFKIKST